LAHSWLHLSASTWDSSNVCMLMLGGRCSSLCCTMMRCSREAKLLASHMIGLISCGPHGSRFQSLATACFVARLAFWLLRDCGCSPLVLCSLRQGVQAPECATLVSASLAFHAPGHASRACGSRSRYSCLRLQVWPTCRHTEDNLFKFLDPAIGSRGVKHCLPDGGQSRPFVEVDEVAPIYLSCVEHGDIGWCVEDVVCDGVRGELRVCIG